MPLYRTVSVNVRWNIGKITENLYRLVQACTGLYKPKKPQVKKPNKLCPIFHKFVFNFSQQAITQVNKSKRDLIITNNILFTYISTSESCPTRARYCPQHTADAAHTLSHRLPGTLAFAPVPALYAHHLHTRTHPHWHARTRPHWHARTHPHWHQPDTCHSFRLRICTTPSGSKIFCSSTTRNTSARSSECLETSSGMDVKNRSASLYSCGASLPYAAKHRITSVPAPAMPCRSCSTQKRSTSSCILRRSQSSTRPGVKDRVAQRMSACIGSYGRRSAARKSCSAFSRSASARAPSPTADASVRCSSSSIFHTACWSAD
jgi:hypothetical protein